MYRAEYGATPWIRAQAAARAGRYQERLLRRQQRARGARTDEQMQAEKDKKWDRTFGKKPKEKGGKSKGGKATGALLADHQHSSRQEWERMFPRPSATD